MVGTDARDAAARAGGRAGWEAAPASGRSPVPLLQSRLYRAGGACRGVARSPLGAGPSAGSARTSGPAPNEYVSADAACGWLGGASVGRCHAVRTGRRPREDGSGRTTVVHDRGLGAVRGLSGPG